MDGIFSAFRVEGFPSIYHESKHPVYGDVVIYGFLFSFVSIFFTFLIVIPGVRRSQKLPVLTRVTFSVFLGAVILICNFGQEWEVSKIKTKTAYKAFTHHEIEASIGVSIGLRSVNITLVAIGDHHKPYINETINYNERFSWEWNQGRNGFGAQAGQFQRDFIAAQRKGLPFPILWIAEYFTFDGEGIRFGRHYRTAGWYSHIMMWLAFPLWLLTNVLFLMVVQYGAVYLFLTGSSMVTANIIFASVRNFLPLEIPFEDATVRMKYGWCFYLNLFTGIISCVLAILVFYLDLGNPDGVATFFGLDVLQDYEDFYAGTVNTYYRYTSPHSLIDIDGHPREFQMHTKAKDEEDETNMPPEKEIYGLRRRTLSVHLKRGQQRRPPPPVPSPFNKDVESELPVYENFQVQRFDPIGEEEEIPASGEASHMGSKEMIMMKDMASK